MEIETKKHKKKRRVGQTKDHHTAQQPQPKRNQIVSSGGPNQRKRKLHASAHVVKLRPMGEANEDDAHLTMIDPNSDDGIYLNKLLENLNESNAALFERIITRVDREVIDETVADTYRVQMEGGTVAADGSGRIRSPGGTFLRMLKQRISEEDIKFIWDIQRRKQRQFTKDKKRLDETPAQISNVKI
eukprot:Filipodium_phascolosomae@DN1679_c0_g1_i1.p1